MERFLKYVLNRVAVVLALAGAGGFLAIPASAQMHTLTATTLSSAVLATDKVVNVTSATGINAPALQAGTVGSLLYVVAPGSTNGETMVVVSVNSTAITVRRSASGQTTPFPSGSMVLVGQPNWFSAYDPTGGCTTASTFVAPWVNTKNGNQWLCSPITLSWVPGFQNSGPEQATVLVASVAGATAVNSPLEHINGTSAITSFTMGPGWNGGGFTIIPDAAFTTTATNNICKASTAVAAKALTYTWDATNSCFAPSY